MVKRNHRTTKKKFSEIKEFDSNENLIEGWENRVEEISSKSRIKT